MIRPKTIPLSVPELRGNELKYLKECIETNWVSYVGPFVSRLEEIVARTAGTPYAVATNSGTAALHTALLVAGIGPGDEVLVPDLTFIAPVNAVQYSGAAPVFIDVTPDTWQLDPESLETFLREECRRKSGVTIHSRTGKRVKAVIPVHLLGHPCDMDPILALAKRYHLTVIEDAAESMGARYKGKPVGSLGDLACFSFNGNKIVTAGGGGAVTTRRKDWALRAKYLTTQAKDSPDEYIHHAVGYNYRLTNIQAAVAVAQMEKLEEYVGIKRRLAGRYEKAFRPLPGLTLPREATWAFSTYWLYTVLVNEKTFGCTSRELLRELNRQGVQARPLWGPIHQQKPYRHCRAFKIRVASDLYRRAVSLPSSVGLRKKDQDRVINLIQTLHKRRSRS